MDIYIYMHMYAYVCVYASFPLFTQRVADIHAVLLMCFSLKITFWSSVHISKLGAGFLFVKAGLIHYDLVTHPFLTFSETMMP